MNNVRACRKLLDLTQEEVAEHLGISEGSYRNKENEKTKFNETEMFDFAGLVSSRFPEMTMQNIFLNRFR